ncbi:hypothetical protein COX97_03050 [Candidatus Pacearchaeota archaeon CG_4_10_14_0_2_um_filter_05_32_18]|nr:MAG: hypothetical protein COX97_03050 [Candidatus Pacearchaeota archaeon CG_4_10_14_0_2_um_filter_05_32_18]
MKHLQPITKKERRDNVAGINDDYYMYTVKNNFFKGLCIAELIANEEIITYLAFAGITTGYIKKGRSYYEYKNLTERPTMLEQDVESR